MFYRVSENVYQIGGNSYSSGGDCCVYLINSSENILIDSGIGRNPQQLIDNIYEVGIEPDDIKYLVLTHCHIDHTGGASYLKDKIKIKIIAHIMDSEAIENGDRIMTAASWYNIIPYPVKMDFILEGEDGFLPTSMQNIKWIHIPGHTPGSIAILFESEDKKILFGQDIHGPLDPSFGSSRSDYKESLKKLIDLDADILCEGHYGIIRGRSNIKCFIEQFI